MVNKHSSTVNKNDSNKNLLVFFPILSVKLGWKS